MNPIIILLDLNQISDRLKLSKSVIKRLLHQQVFPDPVNRYQWTQSSVDKWAYSKKGKSVIRANQKVNQC